MYREYEYLNMYSFGCFYDIIIIVIFKSDPFLLLFFCFWESASVVSRNEHVVIFALKETSKQK